LFPFARSADCFALSAASRADLAAASAFVLSLFALSLWTEAATLVACVVVVDGGVAGTS